MQVCANVKKMNPMELDILVNCQWTNKLLQVTSGTSLNFPIDFDNGTKLFHRRTNGGQPSKITVTNSCLTQKPSKTVLKKSFNVSKLSKIRYHLIVGKKSPKSKSGGSASATLPPQNRDPPLCRGVSLVHGGQLIISLEYQIYQPRILLIL